MKVKFKTDYAKRFAEILLALTEKESKIRYARTFFGKGWVLLFPVIQMLVMGFIFSFFIKLPNYFQFLFGGLCIWNFFSISITRSCVSLVSERMLVQKSKFPVETVPLSVVLSNLENLIISAVLFILYLLITNSLESVDIALLSYSLIMLILLTSGISLLVSVINVFRRDVNFIIQSLIPLLFYATPILYRLDDIPEKFRFVLMLNPMSSIVVGFRSAFMSQETTPFNMVVINIFTVTFIFILGIMVFKINKNKIPDYL